MKRIQLHLIVFFLCVATSISAQVHSLKSKVIEISKTIPGDVGVSVLHVERNDTLTVHGKKHYPMQSVYKFHLALAILEQIDKGNLKLEQNVRVYKDQYFKTHSPLIEKYPDGNVDLSIKTLLEYTILESDNLGCDLLFDAIGGPKKVNHFIHTLGIDDVSILNTERELHEVVDRQFQNWTTPLAMTTLLKEFYLKKILQPSTHDFLWTTLTKTSVGARRIKGLLPKETVVAHRTGTGAPDAEGYLSAVNNSGVIVLPNGDHVIISVFITHLKGEIKDGEGVIAKISQAVFEHYAK